MKVSERMILKDRLKKLGIFCLIVFLPICVVAVAMAAAGVTQAVVIVVNVVLLFLLFGLFMYICSVLDKKKEKRLKESNKKDPFADDTENKE